MYTTQHSTWGAGGCRKTVSWRTGKRAVGSPIPPPIPPRNAGLAGALRARREYLELVAANVASGSRYGGYALTSDTGHDFESLKILNTSPSVVVLKRHDYNPGYNSDLYGTLLDSPYITSSMSAFGSSIPNKGNGWQSWTGPSLPSFSRWISASYADAAPTSPLAGWGETIVELVSGNFPKMLTSLSRRIRQGRLLDPKGVGKDLGSEYLNAQFGILPIVRDVASTIQYLSILSNGLYGEFKRKRHSPREFVSYSPITNTPAIRDSRNRVGYFGQQAKSQDATLFGDVRLSFKMTRARPTLAENDFLARASDHLQILGVSSPTLSWDMIPWSWMIDWFTNIGSSLQNIALYGQDGQYKFAYAYATQKTSASTLTHMAPAWRSGENVYSYRGPSTVASSAVHLRRNQSSPYGPTFALPSLTGGQWAILAALGLAKKP